MSTGRKLHSAAQPTALILLRIDASSEDGHVRIVDTILFDPSCWPIPLLPPLHESVEQNVVEMAHGIISDSEVLGMGRTVRHFTNRVELWSQQLQEVVEHQLRVQLWDVVRDHVLRCRRSSHVDGMMIRSNRGMRHPLPSTEENIPTKSLKSTSSTSTHISLRLTVNNISISDDFDWDSTVPNMCPIDFAVSLAQELNLPSEAAVAIASSIVEQLHGIPMTTEENMVSSSTTAVTLESRDHVANIAHVVGLHRPSRLDQNIN